MHFVAGLQQATFFEKFVNQIQRRTDRVIRIDGGSFGENTNLRLPQVVGQRKKLRSRLHEWFGTKRPLSTTVARAATSFALAILNIGGQNFGHVATRTSKSSINECVERLFVARRKLSNDTAVGATELQPSSFT